ncbi:MAG: hypothetical protein K2M08_08010 [Anaeroplasmataceae bacterium]|nr:hypothetical protein [Anaeroplasmataceae bacterium]
MYLIILSLTTAEIVIAIINNKFKAMYQLIFSPYDFSFTLVLCLLAICLASGILSLILPMPKKNRLDKILFFLTRNKILVCV